MLFIFHKLSFGFREMSVQHAQNWQTILHNLDSTKISLLLFGVGIIESFILCIFLFTLKFLIYIGIGIKLYSKRN